MEIGQAVLALDLIHTKLDLSECVVFVVLQVGEGYLENTALQIVIGVFQTAGSVDDGLADALRTESVTKFNQAFVGGGRAGHTLGSERLKVPGCVGSRQCSAGP